MEQPRAFGSYLRTERELRQIPLVEVSATTKIPLRALHALEEGAWDNLPAAVFVRGFVRSYARHVGLSPDEACRQYDRTVVSMGEERAAAIVPQSVGDGAEVGGRHRVGLALFVIIILIIATITLSLIWRRGASAHSHAAQGPDDPATETRSTRAG